LICARIKAMPLGPQSTKSKKRSDFTTKQARKQMIRMDLPSEARETLDLHDRKDTKFKPRTMVISMDSKMTIQMPELKKENSLKLPVINCKEQPKHESPVKLKKLDIEDFSKIFENLWSPKKEIKEISKRELAKSVSLDRCDPKKTQQKFEEFSKIFDKLSVPKKQMSSRREFETVNSVSPPEKCDLVKSQSNKQCVTENNVSVRDSKFKSSSTSKSLKKVIFSQSPIAVRKTSNVASTESTSPMKQNNLSAIQTQLEEKCSEIDLSLKKSITNLKSIKTKPIINLSKKTFAEEADVKLEKFEKDFLREENKKFVREVFIYHKDTKDEKKILYVDCQE